MAIAWLATGALASQAHAENTAAETPAETASPDTASGETMDLTDEKDSFAPYSNERHPAWALLPACAIAIVLLHLKKSKPQPKSTG